MATDDISVAVEAFLASTGQAHPITQLQRDLTTKCMRAALEALRQSQSLPAGAVAGLVGKWRENADALRSNQPVSDWQRAEELENAADELEQSLQADAREKGEAVDRAALLRVAAELDNQPIFSSQLERARWYVNLSDRITAALATQPAQASEKDNG